MEVRSADEQYLIIFETDGKHVTGFRAGQAEEVGYVEGCSQLMQMVFLCGSKDYGDDSPLHGAIDFTRKSDRASGLTRKTKTPTNG